jgi:hypothetical protein
MNGWEYTTIILSDLPLSMQPQDLLNGAGRDGWELVAITSNGMAYLKRPTGGANVSSPARTPARRTTGKASKPT